MSSRACDRCTARTWLLGRLAGHLECARSRIDQVLALDDDELLLAVGGVQESVVRRELGVLDLDKVRARARAAGLETVCRCDPAYPPALERLAAPPAVLHVAGGLERLLELVAADPVAIVGSRRASPYGLDVARSLGRGLAFSGITIVSGMALGIDSAAHAGALDAGRPTVAVLPASRRPSLPRRQARAAPPDRRHRGGGVRARAGPRRAALDVPGAQPDHRGARGDDRRGRGGGALGRAADGGAGARARPAGRSGPGARHHAAGGRAERPARRWRGRRPRSRRTCSITCSAPACAPPAASPAGEAPAELRSLLAAIAEGHATAAALARAGFAPDQGLAALAELELAGFVRRGAGGRFTVVP